MNRKYRLPPCHICKMAMRPRNVDDWRWDDAIGWVHTPCAPATPPMEPVPDSPCLDCGEFLSIGDWPWCPHETIHPSHHSVHASERAVVFEHPETGEVRYPGRNDIPMPARYKEEGFVRKEFPTLASLQRFESSHGVLNDKAHFNEGNSSDQEAPQRKQLTDREKKAIWNESVQATR